MTITILGELHLLACNKDGFPSRLTFVPTIKVLDPRKKKRVLLTSFVVVPHPPARERAHAHTHHRFMDPKLVADYLTATANAVQASFSPTGASPRGRRRNPRPSAAGGGASSSSGAAGGGGRAGGGGGMDADNTSQKIFQKRIERATAVGSSFLCVYLCGCGRAWRPPSPQTNKQSKACGPKHSRSQHLARRV